MPSSPQEYHDRVLGTSEIRARTPAQGQVAAEAGQAVLEVPAASVVSDVRSVEDLVARASDRSGVIGRAAEDASAIPAAPATGGLMITLKAERACWISAVVDDGERLERLMTANETIVLHTQEEARVRVGNAAALSMLINNQQTRQLGADGQVVDIRVNLDNYRDYFSGRL